MSEKRYNIILTGEVSPGTSQGEAIEAFAQLFKIDGKAAEAAFARAPQTLKKDLSEAAAKKFVMAFKKINVGHKVVLASGGEAAASPQQQAPEPNPAAGSTDSSDEDTDTRIDAATDFKGWAFKVDGRPDYAYLTVQIPADETLKVEASAMAAMDTNIRMRTRLKGGFGRFLTGESLFLNDFTAEAVAGEIGIAPGTPGDLTHQYLDGDTIYLQNSAYVASTPGVEVESKWQGMIKGFFSGESLFLIRCSGQGDVWFNTYGAIIEIDVNDDYVVDTGNIVAFTEGLDYNITKVGGYKSLFFSGEGFVCRFSGQGKVWIQTRSAPAFTSWAHWFRPVKKSNNN